MPTVAEQLRLAREHQKMTVQQIADVMKVRCDQVRALDAGQYDSFPAPVYVKGFIRTYATILKLNLPDIMAALDDELNANPRFKYGPEGKRPISPTVVSKVLFFISSVNWTVVLTFLGISLGLLLSLAGYRAWSTHRNNDQHLDMGPGLFLSPNKNQGSLLPLPAK